MIFWHEVFNIICILSSWCGINKYGCLSKKSVTFHIPIYYNMQISTVSLSNKYNAEEKG